MVAMLTTPRSIPSGMKSWDLVDDGCHLGSAEINFTDSVVVSWVCFMVTGMPKPVSMVSCMLPMAARITSCASSLRAT